MKTLHLILKSRWYDMIASGEKKEEYRGLKPYYIDRLTNGCFNLDSGNFQAKHTTVTFHRGYTDRTMTFSIKDLCVGPGNPDWGAEPGKNYFVIKLGERQ